MITQRHGTAVSSLSFDSQCISLRNEFVNWCLHLQTCPWPSLVTPAGSFNTGMHNAPFLNGEVLQRMLVAWELRQIASRFHICQHPFLAKWDETSNCGHSLVTVITLQVLRSTYVSCHFASPKDSVLALKTAWGQAEMNEVSGIERGQAYTCSSMKW